VVCFGFRVLCLLGGRTGGWHDVWHVELEQGEGGGGGGGLWH
jgi:hypothetical protein